MSNLLTKAKSIKNIRRTLPISDDELALAVAFYNGEVSAHQVRMAIGLDSETIIPWKMSVFLRNGLKERRNRIKII